MLKSALLCFTVLLTACGPTLPPMSTCSALTCNGCCASNGICEPGNEASACGERGAACTSCSSGTLCQNAVCTTPVATLPAGGKLVFATSGEYNGNLGGASGADAKCAAAASAGNLPGTWVAWISYVDPGNVQRDAISRVTSTRPFFLTCPKNNEYVKVFNNSAQLAGAPLVRIDCNEFGQAITTANSTTAAVWTGTSSGGTLGNDTCNPSVFAGDDWKTSGAGNGTIGSFGPNQALTEWTSSPPSRSCSTTAHLYCFQL